MVVLLVAIMALVAIPQFLDFQTEAKNAATSGALGAMRGAIANQKANMIMRCQAPGNAWPLYADVAANNIATTGGVGQCDDPAEITGGDVFFVSGDWPKNSWDGSNAIVSCVAGAWCAAQTGCTAAATFTGGWCYDPLIGKIFADSSVDGENLL